MVIPMVLQRSGFSADQVITGLRDMGLALHDIRRMKILTQERRFVQQEAVTGYSLSPQQLEEALKKFLSLEIPNLTADDILTIAFAAMSAALTEISVENRREFDNLLPDKYGKIIKVKASSNVFRQSGFLGVFFAEFLEYDILSPRKDSKEMTLRKVVQSLAPMVPGSSAARTLHTLALQIGVRRGDDDYERATSKLAWRAIEEFSQIESSLGRINWLMAEDCKELQNFALAYYGAATVGALKDDSLARQYIRRFADVASILEIAQQHSPPRQQDNNRPVLRSGANRIDRIRICPKQVQQTINRLLCGSALLCDDRQMRGEDLPAFEALVRGMLAHMDRSHLTTYAATHASLLRILRALPRTTHTYDLVKAKCGESWQTGADRIAAMWNTTEDLLSTEQPTLAKLERRKDRFLLYNEVIEGLSDNHDQNFIDAHSRWRSESSEFFQREISGFMEEFERLWRMDNKVQMRKDLVVCYRNVEQRACHALWLTCVYGDAPMAIRIFDSIRGSLLTENVKKVDISEFDKTKGLTTVGGSTFMSLLTSENRTGRKGRLNRVRQESIKHLAQSFLFLSGNDLERFFGLYPELQHAKSSIIEELTPQLIKEVGKSKWEVLRLAPVRLSHLEARILPYLKQAIGLTFPDERWTLYALGRVYGFEIDFVLQFDDGSLICVECDSRYYHRREDGDVPAHDVFKDRLLNPVRIYNLDFSSWDDSRKLREIGGLLSAADRLKLFTQ